MLRTSMVLIMLILAASLQADEPIRHSFFIAGPSFTGIIAEEAPKNGTPATPARGMVTSCRTAMC